MERTSLTYKTYLEILNRELVCAMGCTEPIAIAYCAAAARRALGALPTCIEVAASGNIIKNVKSVIVPNTGGLREMCIRDSFDNLSQRFYFRIAQVFAVIFIIIIAFAHDRIHIVKGIVQKITAILNIKLVRTYGLRIACGWRHGINRE